MRINKLASAACLVLLSLPAMANEVYTYTGNTMNVTYVSGGGYTTTDKVTGSFITSSPLAANLALADISFLSYSFNDGVQTMTNTNSSEYGSPNGFEIATDASGNITSWNIVLNIASTLDFINTSNDSVGDGMQDNGEIGTLPSTTVGAVGNTQAAGTWTKAAVSTTPEPSSFLLLGTGLLGVFGAARRRFNV